METSRAGSWDLARGRRAAAEAPRRWLAGLRRGLVAPDVRSRGREVVSGFGDASGRLVGALTERRNERLVAMRRLTRRRIAVLAAGGFLAALLVWLFLFSPWLMVREVAVEVSGPAVDPAAVRAAVEPHLGTPLVRIPLNRLGEEVRQLPGVRAVEVRRDWPDTVAVSVEARFPIAAVPRDGRLALLDSDGVQVGGAVDSPPDGLPVVSVPAGGSAGEALGAVLGVLSALPDGLRGDLDQAGAQSRDEVWFRLRDGARVEWGSAEHMALKLRVLEVLRQRPAAVYDVSAPTRPVTR